jgi:Aminotransferase class-III
MQRLQHLVLLALSQAAVKLARHATKRQSVIVFRGGYHGRTMGTMAMTTSKTIYRWDTAVYTKCTYFRSTAVHLSSVCAAARRGTAACTLCICQICALPEGGTLLFSLRLQLCRVRVARLL